MDFRDGMLKFREIQGISGELEDGNGFLSDRRPFPDTQVNRKWGEVVPISPGRCLRTFGLLQTTNYFTHLRQNRG